MPKEQDLYAPVKAFLESKGYTVKAEVNNCDVVACKDGAPTIIVELKLGFTLDLVLQGVDRQNLSDDIYLAFPAPDTPIKRKNWRANRRSYLKLCRMLGLGVMLVHLNLERQDKVEALLDPAPYTPRKNKKRQSRLMTEFIKRDGDPNIGGTNKTKIITSYRQDALRCAILLSQHKDMKVSDIKATTGVEKAASILQKNHYGWFERASRGVYGLTEDGRKGLEFFAEILPSLKQ